MKKLHQKQTKDELARTEKEKSEMIAKYEMEREEVEALQKKLEAEFIEETTGLREELAR
jgi:hypothetical protein